MFYKTDVLKNFAKLTRKHLWWNLVSNKVTDLQPSLKFVLSGKLLIVKGFEPAKQKT